MKQHICFWFSSAIALYGFIASSPVIAQVTSDTTLPNNSSVTTDGNTSTITGGTQAGGNLFHSFEQFSLPMGGIAYFNNALDIQNIISRVTGKSVSSVDGLIRANGTANLFLLNPNGIIFGPNATLNIGGSFLASTASSLNFADGRQFSANAPQTTPLLTVNVPIGLQFGGTAAGIQVQESRLQVQPGQTLGLIGGNVSIEGGELGFLRALGGRIELGGLTGAGKVEIEKEAEGAFRLSSLQFPDAVKRGDVLLNYAFVDVAAGGGGSIAINARNLEVLGKSTLTAGIASGLGSDEAQAGDITLNATEAIKIGQPSDVRMSSIKNEVGSSATGNSGDININAGLLLVIDSALLSTLNLGEGNTGSVAVQVDGNADFTNTWIGSQNIDADAGSIFVKANGDISFADSIIGSETFGKGDAGSVLVQADGNVSSTTTYISSQTLGTDNTGRGILGQGNAGSITVSAKGNISFADNSELTSNNTLGEGNAGSVLVQADGNVSFTDNAHIDSYTTGEGDAGSVTLLANGNVSFTENSRISSYTTGEGNAGSVLLQTIGDVSFDNSRISNFTRGGGNAGNVSVQANSNIYFTNSFVSSSVLTGGKGEGGNIQIQARSLSLSDGAELSATTKGEGNAGNIQVDAVDSVTISGVNIEDGFSSGLFTNTDEGASGQGGNISIQTGNLRILDGAVLSAKTRSFFDGGDIIVNATKLEIINGGQMLTTAFNSGNAGSITVNAIDSIISGSDPTYFERLAEFDFDSNLVDPVSPASGFFSNTNPGSTGNGGDINVQAERLVVQDGAQVSALTEGQGQGGTLEVNVPKGEVIVTGSGSRLTAEARSASKAGNLSIKTKKLFVQDTAEVTVSGESGQAGDLSITANSIFLERGKLTAVTGAGNGGNIRLQDLDLLLMHNNSLISAAALNTANGGNVDINSKLIIAVPLENSDIIANAQKGNGGRVDIAASGIFGIKYRDRLTLNSDINTSSEFGVGGTVEINTPNIDPSSGLVTLPVVQFDTQVVQVCQPSGSQEQSEFVVTGRGGLPPNPSDLLNNDAVWIDLDSTTQLLENHPSSKEATQITESTAEPLVEATGWTVDDKGEVVLTAAAPTATPDSPILKTANCHVR